MKRLTHKQNEIIHSIRRGAERHDLSLSEIAEIKERVRSGETTPVQRQSNRVCVHEIEHRGSYLYLVYDSKTHEVVTFLPAGWVPTNPFPHWQPPAKKKAYGGVVLGDDGRVLLRKVTGSYKGYVWTFPKGRPDEGETPEETALREVREETGHECEIVGVLGKPFRGLDTMTTYFVMRSLRDHGDFHRETCDVRWATFDEARYLLDLTEHEEGRQRDQKVLKAARDLAPSP
jgi:8-oxo-dGTP pyrophosphatase MutT (NUDIX family)